MEGCLLSSYVEVLWHYPGGGLFGILGKYTNKFGKDPVVLLGMLVHFTTYLLIYYNLPANSIADNSSDSGGALFDHSK